MSVTRKVNVSNHQRDKLSDAINDIGNWLVKKPFKDESQEKVFELLEDSLYSKTVVDAIEKDIRIMLERGDKVAKAR